MPKNITYKIFLTIIGETSGYYKGSLDITLSDCPIDISPDMI